VQPRSALDLVLPSRPTATPWVTRRTVVTIGIFVGVLGLFLTQTRLPATLLKLQTADRAQSARGRVGFAQVIDPETLPSWLQWLAYGVNLWDGNAIGMFFAMLLAGAAAGMFAPAARLRGVLTRRGAAGAGVGGVLGVPLMMCSACSAPVSLGFRRSGASVETSLGVIVGSALFNPIGLVAMFVALPLSMGVSRVGFGLLALFLLVPLAARWSRRELGEIDSCALPTLAVDAPRAPEETWRAAAVGAARDWLRSSAEVAWRLGPVMLAATLLVGMVFTLLPPQTLSDRAAAGILAVVVAAAVGTLLQTPALFEIPLVLGLLFLGLGVGPAVALLITAPAPGLITLALTRRELGWRAPFVLMAGTFTAGVTGGVLLGAL
jgi:uncharacterized membrane protein YraQ (UPF0718 family)